LPGYVPPMEWLKNRKPTPSFGAAKSAPAAAPEKAAVNGAQPAKAELIESAEDRVARARAKAAAIRAQREAQAAQVNAPAEPATNEQAIPDYAGMTLEQINAITDRVERSRAKAAWRKAHPE
jgi:hypothetical protein